MPLKIDLSNQVINNIKFLNFSHIDKHKARVWNCECYCGKKFQTTGTSVKGKHVKSCGCIKKISNKQNGRKSSKWKTFNRSLYIIWYNITSRCCNKTNKDYNSYGGRGISIYSDWKNDFDKFHKWIIDNLGDRPSKTHSLDRINNSKDYEPGNLRWATSDEQNQNKTSTKLSKEKVIEIRNSSLSREELVKKYGVKISQINKILGNRSWKNI